MQPIPFIELIAAMALTLGGTVTLTFLVITVANWFRKPRSNDD